MTAGDSSSRPASAVLLVATIALTGWALWFSRWFTVNRVQASGAHRVSVAQIEAAARVPMGRPVLRVTPGRSVAGSPALTELSSVDRHARNGPTRSSSASSSASRSRWAASSGGA